jgi:hypothetical protein
MIVPYNYKVTFSQMGAYIGSTQNSETFLNTEEEVIRYINNLTKNYRVLHETIEVENGNFQVEEISFYI